MKPHPRHFLITGGTGYIGRRLVEMAQSQGHHVTLLGRDTGDASLRTVPWRLGEDPTEVAFKSDDWGKVDVVIHLAHDWNTNESGDEINLEGTRLLLDAARKNKVSRFVFSSSVSARPEALNCYGRIKARVETLLTETGEIAARVGLVYGGAQEGMWGSICAMVKLSPILPMFGVNKPVQPIHVDEVCDGLLRLGTAENLDQPIYGLASPMAMTFGDFMRQVSLKIFHRNLYLLALPIPLILLAISVFNKIPGLPRVDKERILGIASLQHLPCSDDLLKLGMDIMPLSDGLSLSGQKK